jgi:hypothetical protein
MGNRLPTSYVPAKLTVSAPNDRLEKQADQTAETAVRDTRSAARAGREAEKSSGYRFPMISAASSRQQLSASGGRPLDPATRRRMRPHFGSLVNRVRVHTGTAADRSARAVNARAYTAGANIVFRSGAYAPQTQAGRRLLAHEMAHVARPQPGTLMRSVFDGEDPDLRVRRLAAIRKGRVVIRRLVGALSRGYIWRRFETVRAGGIYLEHIGTTESIAVRETRLRQIVADLIRLVRELEAAPIPADWLAPEVSDEAGTLVAGSDLDSAMDDLVRFYGHRGRDQGRGTDLLYNNTAYILEAPNISRAVSRAALSRGIATGIYIRVPDPVNEPMVYQRLTGYERVASGGVILDVMHDSFGYYYVYRGNKHYMPARP